MTAREASGKIVVSAEQIRSLVSSVLIEHGATEHEAGLQADMLTEGDLRGQHSHGLQRLKVLAGRIRSGVLLPGQTAEHTWTTSSVLKVDGKQGFGPAIAFDALERLTERAVDSGMAAALIRNSNHLGMLAPYAEKAASAGLVAIVLTTSEALVHPWGGSRALLGTNPIAVGVPTADEPFILDMATSEVSMGKVISYAARGEEIPEGWGIDDAGRATTDPSRVIALTPFGGPKGYALGLAFELLVGGLTQTAFGADVHGTLDTDLSASKGDIIIVFSPERLGLSDLPALVRGYLDELRGTSHAAQADRVLVPGDRARAQRAHSLREGVELDEIVWLESSALLSTADSPTGPAAQEPVP